MGVPAEPVPCLKRRIGILREGFKAVLVARQRATRGTSPNPVNLSRHAALIISLWLWPVGPSSRSRDKSSIVGVSWKQQFIVLSWWSAEDCMQTALHAARPSGPFTIELLELIRDRPLGPPILCTMTMGSKFTSQPLRQIVGKAHGNK